MPGFECVLPFDVDGLPDGEHHQFVRGFEAGRFWTQLQDEDTHEELLGQPLHAENAEMVIRMGEVLGLAVAAEAQDDTWIKITSIKALSDLPEERRP